jgi:predicted hexulose-6-phosphate isomerase
METCLGLYEKAMPAALGLEDKLRTLAGIGFDFLEISIDETEPRLARLRWSAAERRELAEAMARTGVGIRTLCLSAHRKFPLGSADPALRARGLAILADAIAFAADLGIRIIQLAGYDCYYEPSTEGSRALFLSNLRTCAEWAARSGVLLAFETMETEFMNTVAKAMRWVRIIDSPYLQVYPDVGNLTNAAVAHGTSVSADLWAGRGHLVAMHLKETVPGRFREVPYGAGHVDFRTAIRTAEDLGVRLFLAECWDTGQADWRDRLQFAHDFLREKL